MRGAAGLREDSRVAAKTGKQQTEKLVTQIAPTNHARNRQNWVSEGGEKRENWLPTPRFNGTSGLEIEKGCNFSSVLP